MKKFALFTLLFSVYTFGKIIDVKMGFGNMPTKIIMEENSTIDFDYSSYHCKFKNASSSPDFLLEDNATFIRITHTVVSEKGAPKLNFECKYSERVPVIKGGSIEILKGELVNTLRLATVEVVAQ